MTWGTKDTIIFVLIDCIIFGIMVYFFHINWMVAFVASTVASYGLYYLYYYLFDNK